MNRYVWQNLYDNCTFLTMQVNGVNLLRIPSKDAYAYGRTLLDHLFTKQEQKAQF